MKSIKKTIKRLLEIKKRVQRSKETQVIIRPTWERPNIPKGAIPIRSRR